MKSKKHIKYVRRLMGAIRFILVALLTLALWFALLMALVFCCGCSSLKPSWQGLYLGTELVSPFSRPNLSPDSEATAIIGLTPKVSLQGGVYWNLQEQGFRIAIERRIF